MRREQTYRICKKCGVSKPLQPRRSFRWNGQGGFDSVCKACLGYELPQTLIEFKPSRVLLKRLVIHGG